MPYAEKRLDRHPAYIWVHIGLWFVALGILLAPLPPNSALQTLSWDVQQLLGACMFVGSSSALFGTLMGWRWFFPRVDRRTAYAYGGFGMLAVSISMWTYAYTIAFSSSLVGTLGGGLTLAIGGLCWQMVFMFTNRVVRMTRIRGTLRDQIERR